MREGYGKDKHWVLLRLCVFITAGPIIKLFAWGEGDSGENMCYESGENMCYERRRAEACGSIVLREGPKGGGVSARGGRAGGGGPVTYDCGHRTRGRSSVFGSGL